MSQEIRKEIIRKAEENLERRKQAYAPGGAQRDTQPAPAQPQPSYFQTTRFTFLLCGFNLVAWIVLLPFGAAAIGCSPEQVAAVFGAALVFIPFYGLLTYVYFRLFWWITGCLWTAATTFLLLSTLAILLGFVDPASLGIDVTP